VGHLIHPDHCRNRDLQTLLSQYYEDILDMKGASRAVQIRELKFQVCKSVEPPPPPGHFQVRHPGYRPGLRPTTAATPAPTPKASRLCLWQSPSPLPRCEGGSGGAVSLAPAGPGAAGQRTWLLPGLHQPLRPNRRGVGRARELVLGEWRVQWLAKCNNHWATPGRIFERQAALR
jgi:hypothetical protein